jgi:hypothetical protein
VKITVNVHGEITAIEFPTGGYKRMTPLELAETITTTVAAAKAKAVDELKELMLPKLPGGVDFADIIQGKADLMAALPEEPRMPDDVNGFLQGGLTAPRLHGGGS